MQPALKKAKRVRVVAVMGQVAFLACGHAPTFPVGVKVKKGDRVRCRDCEGGK